MVFFVWSSVARCSSGVFVLLHSSDGLIYGLEESATSKGIELPRLGQCLD